MNTINASDLIALARVELRSKHPFYGVLASHLTLLEATGVWKSKVKTFAVTKGGLCLYNKEYAETLSLAQMMGILAHESLHPALGYFDRIPEGCPTRKNMAHDHVINLMILSEGLKLPDGALANPKYQNMCFEEVYGQLNERQISNFDLKDCSDQELLRSLETEFEGVAPKNKKWRNALYQAQEADLKENNGKSIGRMPGHLQLDITSTIKPKLDYKALIKQSFTGCGRKILASFHKRNKLNSFQSGAAHLPGLRQINGKCFVVIDTSGSLFNADPTSEIALAFNFIKQLSINAGLEVWVVECDTHVRFMGKASDYFKKVNAEGVIGGGGSNFCDAFEQIWAKGLRGKTPIFAFTDGAIVVPEKNKSPSNPVIWLCKKGNSSPTNEWGRRVELNC